MKMSLYELENRINEYIKENELDNAEKQECDNYILYHRLINVVKDILGDDSDKFNYYNYSSCSLKNAIQIKGKYDYIIIEYKRTRYIKNSMWNNYAYYGIKSVEIYFKDTYKSLEDFLEQDKIDYDNYKKKKENDYENMLEKIGLCYKYNIFTLNELLNFKNDFSRLDYARQQEIKEIVKELENKNGER